jgi:hypothetical protein
MFAACANSADAPSLPTTGTQADASADAKGKKDTGTSSTDTDSGDETDSATPPKKDSGVKDTGVPGDDAGDIDAGDLDAADDDVITGVDASASDTSTGSDALVGCNDLVYGGAGLTNDIIAQDPPTATGGTIADGTYNLTNYKWYMGTSATPGKGAHTLKATIRITGTTIDSLQNLDGVETRATGTFTTSNATKTISITWSCGKNGAESQGYTVGVNKILAYPFSFVETEFTK